MLKKEIISSPLELKTDSTLVEVLRWRAQHQADQHAYIFLADGEQQEIKLSYAELDQRARAIGRTLQRLQAGGQRVLLLFPPGLDYIAAFLGCFYAGAVAVPAYPPHSNRSLIRIQSIVDDSQAAIACTKGQMLTKASTKLLTAREKTGKTRLYPAIPWLSCNILQVPLLRPKALWSAIKTSSIT
jgi:acyl-CoA synthetase (AMP-forming)/AMP-acid ligase II